MTIEKIGKEPLEWFMREGETVCLECEVRVLEFKYTEAIDDNKALETLIRDMLWDIPLIPGRYKYVERLKDIVK